MEHQVLPLLSPSPPEGALRPGYRGTLAGPPLRTSSSRRADGWQAGQSLTVLHPGHGCLPSGLPACFWHVLQQLQGQGGTGWRDVGRQAGELSHWPGPCTSPLSVPGQGLTQPVLRVWKRGDLLWVVFLLLLVVFIVFIANCPPVVWSHVLLAAGGAQDLFVGHGTGVCQ